MCVCVIERWMDVDSYVTICLYTFSKSIAPFIYLFRDVYYLSMCRLSLTNTVASNAASVTVAAIAAAVAADSDDDVVHIFLLVRIASLSFVARIYDQHSQQHYNNNTNNTKEKNKQKRQM